MSGRAKEKRFVIRGKERLDVGLHEDEFLLQAVFYRMAGPNPACRPSMLAPRRRQNLIPPLGNANRPAQIPPAGRPCWRCPAGKALSHRLATPTVRPKSRLPAVYVGAASLAKPYATVGPRQQAGPNPACRPSMLAPLRRQNLMPPSGHANSPPRIPPGSRPCWRPSAGKTLSHRRTTLTGRPESRLPGAHVGALRRQNLMPPPGYANRPARILPAVHGGASTPAKPYATAGPRQQAGPNPACRAPMLAPPRRQNLIPPSGHANRLAQIPPGSRPCWRLAAGKALSHRRATPTGRPESCLPATHVAAAPCGWAAALIYST